MPQTSPRPNIIVMVICGMFTSMVVIAFARLAFGLILPPMRADLGLDYQQAGLLGTITALGYLCFVLVGGIAAARWGARFTIVFGLVSVAAGFAGLSVASAYPVLLVLMALLGFGTAFSFAPMVSLLATWYPERRGLVIGCMTSGVGLGTLLVGLLVPLLYGWFGDSGWRMSWGSFAVAAMSVAVLVILFVRDPPRAVLGEGEKPPSADKWQIYRSNRVLTVAVVYGIIGMTYIVQTVFMVSFMVESGHAESTAGRYLALMGLLSLAAGPLWGWLSDRWGRGNALTASMALVTLAMALPLASQSLLTFFLHFLLMGVSVNGMFALIQASATDQVTARYIPIAFSFVTVFFAAGQLVGPALAGWLIDFTGDFRFAFGLTFAVLAAGAYLTLRIRRFPPATGAAG
jgi:MFS family permease